MLIEALQDGLQRLDATTVAVGRLAVRRLFLKDDVCVILFVQKQKELDAM